MTIGSDEADAVNRGATFLPRTTEDELPAVRIGGMLVVVYVREDGTLCVTVDTEGADRGESPRMFADGTPIVEICLNSGVVFTNVHGGAPQTVTGIELGG